MKVLIAHESPLVAAGIAATLDGTAGIDIATCSPTQARVFLDDGHDVVIAGYDAALACLAASLVPGFGRPVPRPRVLIVTDRHSEWEIRHAISQGASGYLLLACQPDELLQALHATARGSRWFHGVVSERIADGYLRTSLTQRELEVLALLVAGWGNKAIASQLDIALGTVKAHVKAILEKLNVGSRLQAAMVAEQRGMLRVLPSHGAPQRPAVRHGARRAALNPTG